jgi:hypothetical protein
MDDRSKPPDDASTEFDLPPQAEATRSAVGEIPPIPPSVSVWSTVPPVRTPRLDE